jgi:hypothetical protein
MPTIKTETGAGLADANSYASLAYANEYHAARGNEAWSGEDDQLTQALLIAFESLESLYGPNYMGALSPTSAQAALFPRMPFTDNNGRFLNSYVIPACLLQAQCEIALLYLQGVDVFPKRSTAQNVVSESVEVGAVKTAKQYGKAVEGESFAGFRKVDLLLAPILNNKKPVGYRLGL